MKLYHTISPANNTADFSFMIAIIISVYSMIYSLLLSDAEVEKSGMIFVTQDMSQLQGSVNHYLRDGNDEELKVVIANRGSNPNIELLLLADENNVVLHATSLKLPGLPIQQAVPDIDADLINHVRNTMFGKTFLSKKRDSIYAYYPVVIGSRPQELRPSLVGILFMKYDLKIQKVAHRYAVEHQTWQSMSFYTLLFLSLEIYLYYALTKRVMRLVVAAKRFAAGDVSTRSGLQGKDEIAQIGEAFDNMVQKILSDQEAFRESEARFRNLAETTTDWIWEIDSNGVYTYASPAVRFLLGYEPEEVIGKTPFDFMPHEEAQRVSENLRLPCCPTGTDKLYGKYKPA